MNLLADRPMTWNQVVGQPRALKILTAMLENPKFMTRGFIFQGMEGLGKTTMAYLFTRGLLCIGKDPLGCGVCPACAGFSEAKAENSLFRDFTELDAASHGRVENARLLMENLAEGHMISKRRVVLIDEAHRLSAEAWDVFLNTLEKGRTDIVFIFATTDAGSIPKTIRSRCASIQFDLVSINDLVGLLMVIVEQVGIQYKLDGLLEIARLAQGKPRDAIKMLQVVATVDAVTVDNVRDLIPADLILACPAIYTHLANGGLQEAIDEADKVTLHTPPVKLIETMFLYYAKAVFHNIENIRRYSDLREMTAFFLKWMKVTQLPADIVPLFILELSEMGKPISSPQGEQSAPVIPRRYQEVSLQPVEAKVQKKTPLSDYELDKLIKGLNQ